MAALSADDDGKESKLGLTSSHFKLKSGLICDFCKAKLMLKPGADHERCHHQLRAACAHHAGASKRSCCKEAPREARREIKKLCCDEHLVLDPKMMEHRQSIAGVHCFVWESLTTEAGLLDHGATALELGVRSAQQEQAAEEWEST